jgi:hypothetical protein
MIFIFDGDEETKQMNEPGYTYEMIKLQNKGEFSGDSP